MLFETADLSEVKEFIFKLGGLLSSPDFTNVFTFNDRSVISVTNLRVNIDVFKVENKIEFLVNGVNHIMPINEFIKMLENRGDKND